MKIGPSHSDRPVGQPDVKGSQQARESEARVREGDHVEISDAARRRLANVADELRQLEQSASPVYNRADFKKRLEHPPDEEADDARAELLNEIRHRIESGYYDRTDIKRLIADRLSDDFDQ